MFRVVACHIIDPGSIPAGDIWSLSPKILLRLQGKSDSKSAVCGILVYGLFGIQGAC